MNINNFDFNSVVVPDKKEILENIYEDSRAANLPIIGEFTEQVLYKLLCEFQPSNIFEAGCAYGYSSCFMKTHSVKAKIITCDIDGDRVERARENINRAGFSNDIKVFFGDADEVMRSFKNNTFDFIFIDAAKGQYPIYFKLCGEMLCTGGVAVFDNAGFWGMVTGSEKLIKRKRTIVKRMKEFLPEVLGDKRFDSRYLQSGDGVLLCVKKDK